MSVTVTVRFWGTVVYEANAQKLVMECYLDSKWTGQSLCSYASGRIPP